MTNSIKILEPSGVFDIDNGNKLRREVIDLLDGGADIILINLKDVSFMNSSGLGALVATYKTVKTANKQLYLSNLNDQLIIIFELTRMDSIFTIFKTVEDFQQKYS